MSIANFDGKLLAYLVWLGCESDNPFQPSVYDKNTWIHTSKCRYEIMACTGTKMRKYERQAR